MQTEGGIAAFFVGPALLLMVLLNIYPILHSFYVSVHVYNLKRPHKNPYVGFENYITFLESEDFYNAFTNTIAFVVVSVIAVALLGLVFALALNELGTGVRRWVVPLILVPWAVPYVANGLIWEWIYHSDYGVLNGFLVALGVIDKYQTWLSNPARALYTLVNAFVWKEVPIATVLFLTALQAIPEDLYSAAKIDQAGASRRFWHITCPRSSWPFCWCWSTPRSSPSRLSIWSTSSPREGRGTRPPSSPGTPTWRPSGTCSSAPAHPYPT